MNTSPKSPQVTETQQPGPPRDGKWDAETIAGLRRKTACRFRIEGSNVDTLLSAADTAPELVYRLGDRERSDHDALAQLAGFFTLGPAVIVGPIPQRFSPSATRQIQALVARAARCGAPAAIAKHVLCRSFARMHTQLVNASMADLVFAARGRGTNTHLGHEPGEVMRPGGYTTYMARTVDEPGIARRARLVQFSDPQRAEHHQLAQLAVLDPNIHHDRVIGSDGRHLRNGPLRDAVERMHALPVSDCPKLHIIRSSSADVDPSTLAAEHAQTVALLAESPQLTIVETTLAGRGRPPALAGLDLGSVLCVYPDEVSTVLRYAELVATRRSPYPSACIIAESFCGATDPA